MIASLAALSIAFGPILQAPLPAPPPPGCAAGSAARSSAPIGTEAGIAQGRRGKKTPPGPALLLPFAGDLDAARKEAHARNVPLLIVACVEDEPQNDQQRDYLYGSERLRRASTGFVLLVGNNGEHSRRKFQVGKDAEGKPIQRELCSAFRTPTCKMHQETMDALFNTFHEEGLFACPYVLVCTPDRKPYERLTEDPADPVEDSKILGSIGKAAKLAGPGLSQEELANVRLHSDRGRILCEAGDFVGSWRSWTQVLEITQAPQYAKPAAEGQQKALEGMQGERDALVEALEQGRVVEGYEKLLGLRESYEGTPLAKDIPRLIKKYERDKRTKEAIARHLRLKKAQGMWDEAQVLIKDGKQRPAEKIIRLLIRKYADTPIGAQARELYPYLVDE